jgi:hypothetical protein
MYYTQNQQVNPVNHNLDGPILSTLDYEVETCHKIGIVSWSLE